ncbi:hypothetical protein CsSME_00035736 [Camellia sinensis var. sinensis]
MSLLYHEEPPNPTSRCKFLTSTLKDAFAKCQTCRGRISSRNTDEEDSGSNADDDQERFEAEQWKQKQDVKPAFRWIALTGSSLQVPENCSQLQRQCKKMRTVIMKKKRTSSLLAVVSLAARQLQVWKNFCL